MFASTDFWVAIAFVVFIVGLAYLGVPRMLTSGLDKRTARIKAELEEAKRLREEAQKMLADYQRKQREAEQEAANIVAEAEREAETMAAEAKARMEDFVARRTKMAELKIAQAEASAAAEVRAAAADAAVAAAERILAEKVKGKEAARLVESSIESVKTRLN